MQTWQLQYAKAHLSKIVKEVLTDGAQQISLRGEPAVVIMSKKEYDKLINPKKSFLEFLQDSPLKGIELNLVRDSSSTRDDIDL